MRSDVAVVLRTSGERTEDACLRLLGEQIPADRLVVVRERPFSTALITSFYRGLDLGRDWTLCIDADVLLAPNAIDELVASVAGESDNAFGGSGYVVDKFYGKRRRAGVHLYRTCFLALARKAAGEAATEIRPETAVKRVLDRAGHPWIAVAAVHGVHDYHQYYRDIFRKMVTRAVKSPEAAGRLISHALGQRDTDSDYAVALAGLRFGSTLSEQEVNLDVEEWQEETRLVLACLGLTEKDPLLADSVDAATVQAEIDAVDGGLTTRASTGRTAPVWARFLLRAGRYISRLGSRVQRRALEALAGGGPESVTREASLGE